jgi:hypothetical protein
VLYASMATDFPLRLLKSTFVLGISTLKFTPKVLHHQILAKD